MKDFLKKIYDDSYKIVSVIILIGILITIISWMIVIIIPSILHY